MVDLLAVELLKLKRSRMLLLSLAGAALAPIMVVLAFYTKRSTGETAVFEALFYNTSLYTVLLIGVPLYSVVTAYLFSREYTEDTMKNLLTIPVSRTALLLSKMLLLLLWILLLTAVAWGLTLLLGLLGQFDGLSGALLLDSFTAYAAAAVFLFALSAPVILVTITMKNYVPAIILSICISLVNVMAFNSEDRGLLPWTAAFDIAHHSLLPSYPAAVSWAVIAAVSLAGFVSTLLYFRKADIH